MENRDEMIQTIKSVIYEEADVCRNIINGSEAWTATDCEYIIRAAELLVRLDNPIEKIKNTETPENTKKMELIEKIANSVYCDFCDSLSEYHSIDMLKMYMEGGKPIIRAIDNPCRLDDMSIFEIWLSDGKLFGLGAYPNGEVEEISIDKSVDNVEICAHFMRVEGVTWKDFEKAVTKALDRVRDDFRDKQ